MKLAQMAEQRLDEDEKGGNFTVCKVRSLYR